jgi:uncharacterized Fe-S cluster protein YjdI
MQSHKYSNNDITVVWKPGICIHSCSCWKGLPEVFQPQNRPWIEMENSSTEKIIEQVRQCPSGALSYFMNDLSADVRATTPILAQSSTVSKIHVIPNGPYQIQTDVMIVHPDGREETRKGKVHLCRCGASANKPYCDGTHRNNGFTG